ncbi:aldehyde dehydrogenase, partial [Candidatus Woesebacteria bacterium]|nr:aldehyde dehydrogenase [Candidatus Woesebacteria bacterium]
MSTIKVGINGFGRIGRAVARIALENPNIELVQINTRKGKNDMMAYLLQHDSIYRKYVKKVSEAEGGISVDGHLIHATLADKPENIPWADQGVQVVIDATGAFTKSDDLSKHIRDSVKKVILTAPAKDDTPTVVLGVNESEELFRSPIISNASCTTNCAAPLFKILNDSFGIKMGQMTTIHAYTMTQSMMDDANKSTERARAAVTNIVPSSSGAAKAVVKVIPELKGKIEVFAVRVPVPVGSASDLAVVLNREVTPDEV